MNERRSSGIQVLALCGSLRAASLNAALLRTAARLAPPGIRVTVFDGMAALPLFNPDLDAQAPPAAQRLRDAVAAADALLIASPEYAHGVTGVIKTALDWLVSQEAFVDKPVAVLNASPRAHHADAALRETLKTMSALIVEDASVSIALLGSKMSKSEMVESPAVSGSLKSALAALHGAVVLRAAPGPTFPVS
nr:NADPH-dependent FMN reductase [uncultured Roseateles sp.]